MRKAICIICNNVILDEKVKGAIPERKGRNVRKIREGHNFMLSSHNFPNAVSM